MFRTVGRSKIRAAVAVALTFLLLWGGIPVPALAEMTDTVVGVEQSGDVETQPQAEVAEDVVVAEPAAPADSAPEGFAPAGTAAPEDEDVAQPAAADAANPADPAAANAEGPTAPAATEDVVLSAQAQSDSAESPTTRREQGVADLIQEGRFPRDESGGLSAQSTGDVEGAKAAIRQGIASLSTLIDLSGYRIPTADFKDLYAQTINEHPELFFVGGTYMYASRDGYITDVTPAYTYETSAIPAMQEEYRNAVADVLSWVPANATALQKAKAVHDWLVRNVSYNYDALDNGLEKYGRTPWNAYGALVAKTCVCQGYTLAYMDLLQRLGIPCTTMTNSDANHTWNAVCVDSSWYIVDVTWDDPTHLDSQGNNVGDGGFDLVHTGGWPITSYFMKSRAAAVSADGSTNGAHSTWTPASIVCNSTAYDNVNANTTWGNYSGPAANPTVITLDLGAKGSMSMNGQSYTYTGSPITPGNIVVSYDGVQLTQGTDYTLSITNNTNVGAATIVATGMGDYTGTLRGGFSITPKEVGLEWGSTSLTYNGGEQTIAVSATGLVANDTCTVIVEGSGTNAGSFVATVTGLSNSNYRLPYWGLERYCTITPRPAELSWSNTSLTYTGGAQAPTATVSNLVAGDTCTVTVTGAKTDPGTYIAEATGLSNSNYGLSSNLRQQFTIAPAQLDGVSASGYEGTYDGQGHAIVVTAPAGSTVRYGTSPNSYTLTQSPTRTDAGTTTVYYRVSRTGYAEVTGSRSISIAKASVDGAEVTGVVDKTWTGNVATQSPVVTVGGRTLQKNTDYTLAYESNVDAGAARVVVVGKGNYAGQKAVEFTIHRATTSAHGLASNLIYNGEAQTGVEIGAGCTVQGTTSARDAGDYSVTVAPDKNHMWADGSTTARTLWWSIARKSATVTANAKSKVFGASNPALTASVTGLVGSDTLSYSLARADGESVGEYAITPSGSSVQGNYEVAYVPSTLTIVAASVAGATLSHVGDQTYTGMDIEPEPTVTVLGRQLVLGTDYTLSYANNVNVGTATITVAGQGNYTGKATTTFAIVKAADPTPTNPTPTDPTPTDPTPTNPTPGNPAAGNPTPGNTNSGAGGKTTPAPTPTPTPHVSYRTHVQRIGWQRFVSDGAMSGTSGRSFRLEGINVRLSNLPCSGGITYRTHVQRIGWQGWRKDGAMSGTSGKSYRLEAIEIKLYGEMAKRYDVYYRVHCQRFGWMGWAKNGQRSGSAGYSRRLEGIQVVLVPKGKPAPAATLKGIRQNVSRAFAQR